MIQKPKEYSAGINFVLPDDHHSRGERDDEVVCLFGPESLRHREVCLNFPTRKSSLL